MNQPPLTPAEAARVLWQIDGDLQAQTAALLELRRRYPQAVANNRLAYAAAYLAATGTVEDRKQIAVRQSAQQKFDLDTLEQEIAACQDALRVLRDRSEIGRALNSNLKEEIRTLGAQQ